MIPSKDTNVTPFKGDIPMFNGNDSTGQRGTQKGDNLWGRHQGNDNQWPRPFQELRLSSTASKGVSAGAAIGAA